jgi:hypothetical protein
MDDVNNRFEINTLSELTKFEVLVLSQICHGSGMGFSNIRIVKRL